MEVSRKIVENHEKGGFEQGKAYVPQEEEGTAFVGTDSGL